MMTMKFPYPKKTSIDSLNSGPSCKEGSSTETLKSLGEDKNLGEELGEREGAVRGYLERVRFQDEEYVYKDPYLYAQETVDEVLEECRQAMFEKDLYLQDGVKPERPDWPTHEDFTLFNALQKVDEFVQTWGLHEDWKYYLDLAEINEGPFGTEYIIEARFSCPRPEFPVPQATASVYFHMLHSPARPRDSQVEVFFIVESMETKFIPGSVKFNQKWLEIVVDSKEHFFKQIRQ